MRRSVLQRLGRDERGASAIEFALLAPVLLLVLVGTVTMFDLFRNAQNVEKATFTVGDILSRQTSVSDSSLNALMSMMRHTVPTAADGGLRVSSLTRKGSKLELDWSKIVGDSTSVGSAPLPTDILPQVANGDSVILTESFVPHSAMIAAFGLDVVVFKARAVHRPRFVGTIAYQ
jgi:Flp pilus assembly protein TadG